MKAKKIIIGLLVLGALWLGYSKFIAQKSPATTYQTGEVTRGTLVVAVGASGQVSATNIASMTTTSSGVVKKVYVKNGQKVYAGQPIAQIELDQASLQKYLSALASYNSTRDNLYSLQSSLFAANQKFINDAVARDLATDDPTYIQEHATWLAAEAAYKNQQNSITSSSLTLAQASPIIYAPIAGTVTGMSLQEGMVLTSESKVASVITDALPLITVNLTEIDTPKIKEGDKATITFDAISGSTYTGRVISVDKSGSVSSNVTSYPAVIKLDNSVEQVLPNMSAQANIITDTRPDVLLVPSAAVQTINGASTVRVMQKNGQIEVVTVEVGKTSGTETEIVSGLTEGQSVVTGSTSTATRTGASTSGTSVFSTFGRAGGGGFGAATGATFRVSTIGR